MALAEPRQRIDKWLWFARMAKTRTQAQALVAAGAIRINRQKIGNASHAVRVGDTLTIAISAGGVRVLKVRETGERRGPASEARLLYEEILPAAAIAAAPRAVPEPAPAKRPDKRGRRAIIALARGAAEPE